MLLSAGDRRGPCAVVSRIGRGEVWKARGPRLDRDVAIKIPANQFTDRFEREALAIAEEVGIRGGPVENGAVRPLFGPMPIGNGYQYDVSADGRRFVVIAPTNRACPNRPSRWCRTGRRG
jgi:hypothetical protein